MARGLRITATKWASIMSLPSLEGERRAKAEQRLNDEKTIWLTTVRPDGQPQTSPVGFVWAGAGFLIISQPSAPKIRNLHSNAKVALHLDTEREAEDGGVLTLEGVATVDAAPLSDDEASAYIEKYAEMMRAEGITPEEAFSEYSAVIRVTLVRARAY
ncbi:pyridoxamine 5'-phosphate oxidase family protein [Streptomyces gobiensis]|uniref:pyridoxamine 5'-phosphate oxidase family protein n=1 Tax=Streptomyces gobiensis TaxID=2875706 RepID=UPI001E54065C|nr:pyridoxamine 5'-phosphate oxidase family protein [Streptomyces gobiensis]UGY92068.1 pyridoxamine 5'-phosphate oxidase family protein [Streptomyces gobiensis]